MPGDTVNVVTPEGKTIAISREDLPGALRQGYHVEQPHEEAARSTAAGRRSSASWLGATVGGALRGASLGLSDAGLVAVGGDNARDALNVDREVYPATALVSEVGGALLTAVPSGGGTVEGLAAREAATGAKILAGAGERSALSTAARWTPSGLAARANTAISGLGAERGLAAELAAKGAGGAAEGALATGGQYLSQTALEDKPRSAQGFLASLGPGALFGGAAGTTFGVAERGLVAAKRLWPAAEVTKDAAQSAERRAVAELDGALRDGDQLEAAGRAKLRANREALEAADPALAQHVAAVRAEKLAAAQAKRGILEEKRGLYAAQREAAEAKAAALKSGETPPKGSRRGKGKAAPEVAAPDAATAAIEDLAARARIDAAPKAPAPGSLEEQLAATAKRLEGGESIGAINAETIAANPPKPRRGRARATVDDEIDDVVADLDPDTARVRGLVDDYAEAKAQAQAVLAPARLEPGDVQRWIDVTRGRADDLASVQVAKGLLRRDDNVVTTLHGGRDILGAKLGRPAGRAASAADRGVSRRAAAPYTVDEIVAKAENNPMFVDLGDIQHGSPVRTGARNDLAKRILSGKTDPANLAIDELVPREVTDRATGEITQSMGVVQRPAAPREILEAVRRAQAYDVAGGRLTQDSADEILAALRSKLDIADDFAVTVPAIANLERTEAALVKELGPDVVPTGSAQRAADYAEAEARTAETRALADAQHAEAVGEAAKGPIAEQTAAAGKPGMVGRALDAASALEVLSALNIPGLPSAEDIPVVGKLVGLYLKGRAAVRVWKRLGGKIPGSVESSIAERSAATRNRIRAVVHTMLDASAKGAGGARRIAPRPAIILGHALFRGDGDDRREPPNATIAQKWTARAEELQRASEPGAIAAALRARVRTTDPALAQALVDATTRQLAYLDRVMPRPPAGMSLGTKADPWRPPDAAVEKFARIVEAVTDPAAVLERAPHGDVSIEQVTAIREVYPDLYAEAQIELLDAITQRNDVPYARRVQLGILFDVPLDASQAPAFRAAMQATLARVAAPPPPPEPPPSAPSPSIAHPINLSPSLTLQENRA